MAENRLKHRKHHQIAKAFTDARKIKDGTFLFFPISGTFEILPYPQPSIGLASASL